MADESRRKLRRATIIYWVLLLYIVVALAWWFLVLETQNHQIYQLKMDKIEHMRSDPVSFNKERLSIEDHRKRNTIRHIGEGTTFLLFIILGAVFIFRSVRRHFRLQQQQQNFVMAITHELKTPIAVARLNLETMQKHQLDEARRSKLMKTTLQETLRLDMLINNILLSSQLEGHSYHISKEELDFSRLAADVVHQFSSRYPDRHIKEEVESDVTLYGDPLLLKLLISNLLENANKYSPREKPVSFQLTRKDKEILLQVADEGPGIEDVEKKNIFKKFYRIGNEQTRNAKGTGLGLYLCKIIAHDHKAFFTVTNNKPLGSIFTVHFDAK
ncbi:ATP-binding protein [Chitinophagaceae bacterium LB-8]|uniref:histidine kinase n=1 Tax=Paraflavisolibacter caeni TaxID=2982496 RepID=A0A9X2XNB5_9BACT|nr:ATP-binding protein [Paraflavisolibacter caeni]MCU7547814.1 ATP-binding protein [Paraflavisolibacter caeni]